MKAYQELLAYIKNLGSVAVAFSGGVDSSFLAYAVHEALGENCLAITVASPYIPKWEVKEARQLAKEIGINHLVIEADIHENVLHNPSDRCYQCKKIIFSKILAKAHDLGYDYVVDGSNFDDTKDYRPGLRALKELRVDSPLMACQWTKDMIRRKSKEVDLTTYDKPAYACLLTRIPYDTLITDHELRTIEEAEVFMMSKGFRAVRVRSHGDIARIEVSRELRRKLFDEALLDEISETIKAMGYKYVAIEASGYAMGSLNKQIVIEER